MITQDLKDGKEEGYIRYRTPTVYYMPPYNIYNILDVKSGDAFYYAPATFANKVPLVFKFRDMQVGDNVRFVFDYTWDPINNYYVTISSSSKLPVLSMKIDGAETLLPSKIPQIEKVYTAYVDYKITQNMNDVNISLFVRNDISYNGTTILQEPPNVCTEGLICIDVKRADIEPPTFNTINTSNVTASSVTLNINCNEDATAYYKLYNKNATAPTSEELKTTHDAEIVLTANVLSTINAAGLSPNTDYDLYVVAEDTEHNLQITPTIINFSTTVDIGIKGTLNEGINGTLGNGLLAHYSFNDGSLADISGNGNDAMAVGTPDLGVDKDGQGGQALGLTYANYIYSGNFLQGSPEISGSFMFKTFMSSMPIITFISDLPSSYMSEFTIYTNKNGLHINNIGPINAGIDTADYEYHHVVFLSNETGLDLYLDKKYIGKVTKSVNNYTYKICFGQYNYYGAGFTVDEIRFYNRRLTGETSLIGQESTGEIAEIFDMGANYISNVKPKISEIIFNIDFDKVQLGKFIEIKYSDIKEENGVPISNNNIVVKYWSNYDKTPRILNKEGEIFENSIDLYFQIEGEGYETSDIIHKELKVISIDGFQGDYNGGFVNYANHNNDNYKTTESRILIPLTNTSFISYKK